MNHQRKPGAELMRAIALEAQFQEHNKGGVALTRRSFWTARAMIWANANPLEDWLYPSMSAPNQRWTRGDVEYLHQSIKYEYLHQHQTKAAGAFWRELKRMSKWQLATAMLEHNRQRITLKPREKHHEQ